jgi:pyruvate/2-oxoglutarate dehydrogenase complex dihydrolipoamide dehydrogenase (E3) component
MVVIGGGVIGSEYVGDIEGMIKRIFEVPSGKPLGVHVIGEIASELVHIGLT